VSCMHRNCGADCCWHHLYLDLTPLGRLKGDADMHYMLLIYDDEKVWGKMSEQEMGAILQQYREFSDGIRKAGAFKAGNQLQPTSTATTVRSKNGKTMTTDGPFAETKEQLGGYYMIEAKDLEEAIAIAGRIPSVRVGGSVEVRPIVEMRPPK